ncbi:MAG: bifunctional hydroxymethylpyrimidine kinase/phosphomethylpyrimidine kinase [Oribacterium sp.]|nr:bifunctional hydroxymethylpyrimidine kinase/phosphomethylpyrimidine kinase [Oribacterium sp.]
MKHIAAINDLSGVGRCSLSVILPVLSYMGYCVNPVPTAVLSNHTAFPYAYSVSLTKSLKPYLDAWDKNGFQQDAILIGYLGSPEQADVLYQFLTHAREKNPELIIILDPVMGDHGRLYRNITSRYIDSMRKLIRLADLCCPNLTEAAFLSDLDYQGITYALTQCTSEEGRKMVLNAMFSGLSCLTEGKIVVTGIDSGELYQNAVWQPDTELQILYNSKSGAGRPGTGDLFASIMTGDYLETGDLVNSVKRAADFVALSVKHSEEEALAPVFGVQFEDILSRI